MYIEDGRHGMEIEVCVSSIEDVITVQKAGATRIELCTAMEVIGITPTLSNYLLAKEVVDIPVLAFIRPRAGGFNYSDLEFEVMKRDMKSYYDAGARSFVFGILTDNHEIDVKRCRVLIDLCPNSEFIFHKAFDYVNDFDRSIQDLIELGFVRVLTSGGVGSVMDHHDTLKYLIETYGKQIEVMPGGGITVDNVETVIESLPLKSIHLSAKKWKEDTINYIATSYEELSQVVKIVNMYNAKT